MKYRQDEVFDFQKGNAQPHVYIDDIKKLKERNATKKEIIMPTIKEFLHAHSIHRFHKSQR